MIEDIARPAHSRAIINTDNDTALHSLQEEVQRQRTTTNFGETPVVGQLRSNGNAERAVQVRLEQARVMRHRLQSHLNIGI